MIEPRSPDSAPPEPPAASSEGQLAAAPAIPPANIADERAARQALTGRAAKTLSSLDSLSPRQLAWRELRKNRWAMTGLWLLGVLYFIALFGQFFAPFDYQDQNPQGLNLSFHPPMKVRFRDARSGAYGPPFVYGTTMQQGGDFLPDLHKKWPVHFFIHGTPYKLWGFIPTNVIFSARKRGRCFCSAPTSSGVIT